VSELTNKFFQLVRYAISETGQAPIIEESEWEPIFELAKKQAIHGVVFDGVQRMGKDAHIPRQLKMKWFVIANILKEQNKDLNQKSSELISMFQEDGFDCCILKGQGNAIMYPNPYLRKTGDIDLQVKGGRDAVLQYVKRHFPHTKTAFQHVDFPYFKKVSVEIHYLPVYMNNPIYNLRLKRWFDAHIEDMYGKKVLLPDGSGQICVPSLLFNIVFQLAHLMHHLLDEGIGLRHMLDYFFLLRKVYEAKIPMTGIDNELNYLGLRKFAGAVMYIMHDVLGLEESCLIVPADRKRGKTLLREILCGGNFGKYSGLTDHSLVLKHFLKYWRTMHFICEYPAEAFCEPFFRTWHFFWRWKHS